MAFYIRTKDNRILLDTDAKSEDVWNTEKGEDNIFACNENLEELCDGFVIKWSNGTYCKTLMDNLDQAKYWLKQDNNATIYGSIWVDGNLIKVAKMNEKGELELL